MTIDSTPIFIVGSGRSGTRTMFRMLAGAEGLEIHHEYLAHHVQRLAASYYMGLVTPAETREQLRNWHGSAVHHSTEPVWADSSHKLTWMIEPLSELFPKARFLAIVRDGRKVVSSFYYKLREEIYHDESIEVLKLWLGDPSKHPEPPPEKRYWWNIPGTGQYLGEEFAGFDRTQRIAWHWAASNREILERFAGLPEERTRVVRLEDLVEDEELLRRTIDFMGLGYDEAYFEYLQTPRHVLIPLDFQLTRSQRDAFDAIATPMMAKFGYDQKQAYDVTY